MTTTGDEDEVAGILRAFAGVGDVRVVAEADGTMIAEVAPPASAFARQGAMQESVWKMVFEQTFGGEGDAEDPTFHPTVWGSTYTGKPIATEDIKAWIDGTVERIVELQPKRVLEIGCGDGQIMMRVLPHCEAYVGLDFSAAAVAHVQKQLDARGGNGRVLQRSASELQDLGEAPFDVVVMNSVAQYFPSLDYFLGVVKRAEQLLVPGGAFFVGDVRDLSVVDALYTSVELYLAEPGTTMGALRERIAKRRAAERELLLHPAIAHHLGARFVHLRAKPGAQENELVRFRFDLVLRFGGDAGVVDALDHERLGGLFEAMRRIEGADANAVAPLDELRALEHERRPFGEARLAPRPVHLCATHPVFAKAAGRLAQKLAAHLAATNADLAARTRIAIVPAIAEPA